MSPVELRCGNTIFVASCRFGTYECSRRRDLVRARSRTRRSSCGSPAPAADKQLWLRLRRPVQTKLSASLPPGRSGTNGGINAPRLGDHSVSWLTRLREYRALNDRSWTFVIVIERRHMIMLALVDIFAVSSCSFVPPQTSAPLSASGAGNSSLTRRLLPNASPPAVTGLSA